LSTTAVDERFKIAATNEVRLRIDNRKFAGRDRFTQRPDAPANVLCGGFEVEAIRQNLLFRQAPSDYWHVDILYNMFLSANGALAHKLAGRWEEYCTNLISKWL
jgi:hypothetical protein